MADSSTPTVVYTDGACSGNPGPGGWAWAVAPSGPFAAGSAEHTTNQRMEITAVLEAIRALDGALEIRSDSTYVVNCFRDRWWEAWLRKGWVNSQRKPVANRDLWEPLIDLYRAGSTELRFVWVKGHSSDPMNDVVDRLAVAAGLTQRARSGDGLPDTDELGPADVAGGRDARLPPGRAVLVAGHRPPELGGYEDNPVAAGVRRKLAEILAAQRELHPALYVVTGLQLGAEQLGAEAARDAGVPYVVVQPYPAPDKVWPARSRDRYAESVRHADAAVLLERKVPDSRQKAGAALARRDGWLARQVDEAIVVWDGDDRAVGRLVRSLRNHLGEEEVWVVEPGSGA
ncbi:MAG: SLOG family protein [Acidimicrobiales bacterium]